MPCDIEVGRECDAVSKAAVYDVVGTAKMSLEAPDQLFVSGP